MFPSSNSRQFPEMLASILHGQSTIVHSLTVPHLSTTRINVSASTSAIASSPLSLFLASSLLLLVVLLILLLGRAASRGTLHRIHLHPAIILSPLFTRNSKLLFMLIFILITAIPASTITTLILPFPGKKCLFFLMKPYISSKSLAP